MSYKDYVIRMRKIDDISNAVAVLSWDNEVYLPPSSNHLRARQISTLTGMIHEEFTSPEFGKLLEQLQKEKLAFKQKKNVATTYKDYCRDKKFTTDFVMKKSLIVSKAYHSWIEARKNNNYTLFVKALDDLIKITKEEAETLGYSDHAYDAMLDLYEAGASVKNLDVIFDKVRMELIPLIKEVRKKQNTKPSFLFKKYDKDTQWEFGLYLLRSMGFDFSRGRQDLSTHPFTISFGSDDVRVTTRIDERDFSNMTWSCIHEGGHALYEQGLPANEYGLPSGSAASLGIHESQSRLWENNVGRSLEFWQYHFPQLKKTFPENLKNIRLSQFYKAINHIHPGKVRTEADELHYHLHVLIRYEIEKQIFEGKIKAKDLREVWNEKYKTYIGVTIKNDNEGILQDVHWAHGSFGYFPTYSLGSFYAAQFFKTACSQVKGLKKQIATGNTTPLLVWLKSNIYRHGKTYNAEQLCKKVTGGGLDIEFFMDYVREKYLKDTNK